MLTNTHSITNHRVDLFSMLAVAEGFGTPGYFAFPCDELPRTMENTTQCLMLGIRLIRRVRHRRVQE